MKKITILGLLFLMTLNFYGKAQAQAQAQANEYATYLFKMQKLNGSFTTYDIIFKQLKMAKPSVNDSTWVAVKKEIFDAQVEKLTLQLIPIFQKHYTLDDLKDLISFYESPIGKKLSENAPLIMGESMQISQKWGMALVKEIQDYINKHGLEKQPVVIQKMENK